MKPTRTNQPNPSWRGACERIAKRLDEMAEREGWNSNDEITRALLKHMFDDDGEIEESGKIEYPK